MEFKVALSTARYENWENQWLVSDDFPIFDQMNPKRETNI